MSLPVDDTLSLPVILAWLRANWGKMVLGGVVLAVLVLPVALLKSKTYEATATLLVFPPTFKDSGSDADSIAEMMPRTLPMEAYKALAMAPSVLDEVIRRVPLENTGVRALRNRLEVELVQRGSRSAQGITYTQALMLHATGNKPELAAQTAQTWAEVFKEQMDGVATKGVSETFALLDALHENTRGELEQADLALAEHRKAWNLELIQAQIDAKQKELTEFEGSLKQTEVKLAAGEVKLAALEAELAQEPQKLVYFRAPSDDAYWITALGNGGKGKVEPDDGLRTEEPNPTYVALRSQVIEARENLEGLKAEKGAILLKLEELNQEIRDLTALHADQTVEREKLTRESESLKSSYATVRAEYEKGLMADRTQASDIVIAGRAVAPDAPSSPGNVKVVLVAAVLGTLLTGGFLLLRDISEMVPVESVAGNGLGAILARTRLDAPAVDGAAEDEKETARPG